MGYTCVPYPCVVDTVEKFVRQIDVGYVRNGYTHYVDDVHFKGRRPEDVSEEELATADRRIIKKYHIDIPSYTKSRKANPKDPSKKPISKLQYLRLGMRYVIFATKGVHKVYSTELEREISFWENEEYHIKDIRKNSIVVRRYAIRSVRDPYGNWRASVRLTGKEFRELKGKFLGLATWRTVNGLIYTYKAENLEMYWVVREQLKNINERVNKARQRAGYKDYVPDEKIVGKLKPLKIFEEDQNLRRAA